MEALFIFLLKVSGCLAIFYSAYLLIFRNDINFKIQRFYLIASVCLSLILPFNNYALRQYNSVPAQESISAPVTELQNQETANPKWANQEVKTSLPNNFSGLDKSTFSLKALLKWLYITVTALLLFRIISGFLKFCALRIHSRCDEIFHTRVYLTDKINGSANIFGFIFLNPSLTNDPKLSQIILHEKIHASQYHSIDILLAELLAAAMWFNPVVWFLRRSLQQIHEYLADDGVLRSGVNRLEYQKLLVNQIAEENLLLSSGFQSSIKKRMIMMTKHKTSQGTKRKLLAILPIAAGILIAISCMNKPSQDLKSANETLSAVAPTKMNVLYIGVDNPVNIAVSNHSPSEVRATIDNGSLTKNQDGTYTAKPKEIGNAIISLYIKDKLINQYEFRVKRVPDPVAYVAGQKGGEISLEKLLKADKVDVMMENFDYDLKFQVIEFEISAHDKNGFFKDEYSKTNKITPAQVELLKKQSKGWKIYFLDIKCAGPDGGIRELPPLVFKIL